MSANVSYVGKPCPKCRHVRTAADGGPDWQCPKCGIAYAKFGQPSPAPVAARGPAVAAPASRVQATAIAGGGSTGLAMFVHLSILIGFIVPFFGLIVPIIVWITKSGRDDLAVANAKEAINFQITTTLWALLLVGLVMLGFKVFVFFFVAGALGVALAITFVVLPIIAAVKANGGEEYRYPLTAHIFS
ncbi:MAG: uncharacterized protein QOD26_4038 [Betaproteobacteria bacterium]|jgi:uncharacterized Tic20 family protein|nr:uncharacterized protein [Betaproteobacteria bacterium]